MELHTTAQILAYSGAMLGVGMVLPQLTRTIRHPGLPGVSPTSWALTTIACIAWLIYGLRADVLPQIPGNVLLIIGAVAVVLLVPSAWSRSRRVAYLGTASAATILVSLGISPMAVGYLAFAISMVSLWPQVVDSYGNWRMGIVSGVSLPTWWVKLAATGSWLSYSIIAMDVPVLIASILGGACNVAVFVMEGSARQAAGRRVALAFAEA